LASVGGSKRAHFIMSVDDELRLVMRQKVARIKTAIDVSIRTAAKRSRGSELRTEGRAKKPRNTMSNSKQYSQSYGGYATGCTGLFEMNVGF